MARVKVRVRDELEEQDELEVLAESAESYADTPPINSFPPGVAPVETVWWPPEPDPEPVPDEHPTFDHIATFVIVAATIRTDQNGDLVVTLKVPAEFKYKAIPVSDYPGSVLVGSFYRPPLDDPADDPADEPTFDPWEGA